MKGLTKKTLSNNIADLLLINKETHQQKLENSFPRTSLIFEEKIPVIIYGTARLGRLYQKNLTAKGIEIAAFADSNQNLWGTLIDGIKVISPDELKKGHSEKPVLIASLMYETEIYDFLKELKLSLIYPLSFLNYKFPDIFCSPEYQGTFDALFESNNNRILEALALFEDEQSIKTFSNLINYRLTMDKSFIKDIRSFDAQYLDPLIEFSNKEVFLDCGAYNGDSVEQFYRGLNSQFSKIYSFEPDRDNFKDLQTLCNKLDANRITPLNLGLYKTSGELKFAESGGIDTRTNDSQNSVSLPVVSIDNFVKDKEIPTFIKMDIEGSEADALLGAQKTIEKYKPKMAISIYHKAADLWELPLLIRQLNDNYTFYLRHYSNEIVDTVCYAL